MRRTGSSKREFSCNSAPGQSGCVPVGKVVSSSLTGDNLVTQYRINDRTIINGTLDGHRYHDGYVVRWLNVNSAGDVSIFTYGLGTNSSRYLAIENQAAGNYFRFLGNQNKNNVQRALNR